MTEHLSGVGIADEHLANVGRLMLPPASVPSGYTVYILSEISRVAKEDFSSV